MRSAALDEIRRTADLLKIVEQDVPALAGRFNGRYTPEVPCPKCGGNTRFCVRLGEDGVMWVFCRRCAQKGLDAVDYIMWRDGITGFKEAVKWWQDGSKLTRNTFPGKSFGPPNPLDMTIADTHHATLAGHRGYFRSRGISDELIARHKLGWNASWKRYAIPCIVEGNLWAIQYRIRPELEKVLKAAGKKYCKYLSEKGGHNKQLFNAEVCGGEQLPYLLVVEGPLDALMLTSLGRPAVAAFQGNNRSRAWESIWNKWLLALTVMVVPDNDRSGDGMLFALDKCNNIPHSIIKMLPSGMKDAGELYQSGGARAISEWLGLRPLRKV